MSIHQFNLKSSAPAFFVAILIILSLACGIPTRGMEETPAATPTLPPAATSAPAPTEAPMAAPTNIAEPQQAEPTQPPAPAVQGSYKIGDVISLGDYVLVILGWDTVPGSEYNQPEAGNRFVAVEALVANNSAETLAVSTLLQMNLKDDTGQNYDASYLATMGLGGGGLDGQMVPGEVLRGYAGFEIPENAQGFEFAFDASYWGLEKIFIDLGAEPSKVDAPADLGGEINQQIHKIGDVISMGTTTLTVSGIEYSQGQEYSEPSEGYEFLVVDLTLENKGSEPVTISSLMQMAVKDADHYKYTVDLFASMLLGQGSPDGEIAAGEKLRGQVGFQVPEDAAGLMFVFDAGEDGHFFVALQ